MDLNSVPENMRIYWIYQNLIDFINRRLKISEIKIIKKNITKETLKYEECFNISEKEIFDPLIAQCYNIEKARKSKFGKLIYGLKY